MGINSNDLNILIKLVKEGYIPKRAKVIEIGAQQLSNSFLEATIQIEEIAHLLDSPLPHPFPASVPTHIVHGVLEHQSAEAISARVFWNWLNFSYASIDIDGSPNSISLDLNYDEIPESERSKYQLVTNFGTTEHVANQLNAFKVIHDLTVRGGIMMHTLPTQGMLNHGLVNYNPKFFWMLSRSNGYKWIYSDFIGGLNYYELPQNIVDNVAVFNPNIIKRGPNLKVSDCCLVVVMQKVFDTPYVAPLDVPTGITTDNITLKKRYWSVFNENAFIEPHKYVESSASAKVQEGFEEKKYNAKQNLEILEDNTEIVSELNLKIKKESSMRVIRSIKNFLRNTAQSVRASVEIKEGIANQSSLINNKLNNLIEGVSNQSTLINNKLSELIEGIKNQTDVINRKLTHLGLNSELQAEMTEVKSINNGYQAPPTKSQTVEEALQQHPLLFARKTYNTSHPKYDANLVRNFPGKIFNLNAKVENTVYNELKKMINGEEITEVQWGSILRETLEEAKKVPHADQVFERKLFVEKYLEDLEAKYNAFYRPGWVNLDDALFLYWVVRKLKPKVIVQTGVCNGLSSAFMMLALAKNGPEGSLHVVDMPPIFDSKDDNWKVKGKVYGVTIPEGKNSGWIVPDAYRDRFEVLSGDAKLLLPGLLQKVGMVDMFYHDSDHTYDHMMFEFEEAKKYLTKAGVVVSDDISWNASLWDFADQYHVPSYNYRGSMGIACF